MRLLNLAPLVILASTLCAVPYAVHARIAEPAALGTRVVPLRPAAALVRRTNKCPTKHHRCYGGCCPEEEKCCDGMFWTIQYLADDILLILFYEQRAAALMGKFLSAIVRS
jgi:hypothetical protein